MKLLILSSAIVCAISAFAQGTSSPISLSGVDVPGRSFTASIESRRELLEGISGSYAEELMRAATPKRPGYIRVLFLGADKVSGYGLPENQTLAAQIEADLQASGKKIEMINAAYPEDVTFESLNDLPQLLKAFHPDFVFYFLPVSSDFVRFAALDRWVERDAGRRVVASHFYNSDSGLMKFFRTAFAIDDRNTPFFLRLLNIQVSEVRMGRELRRSNRQSEDLIRPAAKVLKEAKNLCADNNANFFLIWSGLGITRDAWSGHLPKRPGYWPLRVFEVFKTRVTVGADKMVRTLSELEVPQAISFEAGDILHKMIFGNPQSRKDLASPETVKSVADAVAPTILHAIY